MNYSVEQTAAEAVKRFFLLAVSQEQLKMAQEQIQSCDTILAIGNRRFRIASISRAELDILTLQRSLAATTLKSTQPDQKSNDNNSFATEARGYRVPRLCGE